VRKDSFRSRIGHRRESGQAMLFVLLGLGIFLIGAMAFAIDVSNMWFNRQSAQTAADAACTAGAMDLLVDATNGLTQQGNFGNTTTAAVPFDCNTTTPNTATTNPAPCVYAALNGYNSSIASGSNSIGNNVSVDFPSSVPGVTTPPSGIAPTPFLRVKVTNNIPTFFAGMLRGMTKQSIGATAVCGLTQSTAPIPIIVLDPHNPSAPSNPSALDVQGNPVIRIVGGPSQSIQVNSNNSAAVNVGGTGQINLSQGGPGATAGAPGTGSDIGIFGGPTAVPTVTRNFDPGTTGHWNSPAGTIQDPFAQVCAPGQTGCPTINGNSPPAKPTGPTIPTDEGAVRFPGSPCTSIPCSVGYKDHGCPETTATRANGLCLLYTPGLYDSTTGFPSGLSANGGGSTGILLLFDPGVYYIAGGISLGSNSTVRPGTGDGDGSGGVVFYFKGTSTITVASDSGSKAKDPFNTMTGPHDSAGIAYPNDATHYNTTVFANGVRCTASSSVPNNLSNGGAGVNIGVDSSGNPAGANIILGPCTGYYGDSLGASDPLGLQRGFVFFQDRSAQSVHPSWGGGGQFLLAGTMYFHSCNSTGTGLSCGSTPTYFNDIFTMQGNSGSNTYVLGQIVTDNLALGGTSGLTMDLNPNVVHNVLKVSLYQ